jgi:hypothetical protein
VADLDIFSFSGFLFSCLQLKVADKTTVISRSVKKLVEVFIFIKLLLMPTMVGFQLSLF